MAGFKVFPEKIVVENFKSIKSVTLRLKPGVNLLVGPNLAGKTNILEAIHFLSRALSRRELSKIPYMPHAYYSWSPEGLFYMKDTRNPITFRVRFRVTRKEGDNYYKTYITFGVKFGLRSDRSTVEPIHLEVDWGTAKWDVQDTAKMYISKEHLKDYLDCMEKALGEISARKETRFTRLREELEFVYRSLERVKEEYVDKKDEHVHLFTAKIERSKLELVLSILWRILFTSIGIPKIYTYSRGEKVEEFYLVPTIFQMSIAGELREKSVSIIPILLTWQNASANDFVGYVVEIASFDPIELFGAISGLLENVVLLKHPDISSIGEPQVFGGDERLDTRARNLPQLLYRLMAERRVGVVEEAVRKVFGDLSIEPRSVANRVFFVVKEKGVELPPPNIADGVIKVLAISVAVELKPFILLIDEVENSLHIKALEHVFDLLNSLEVPVVLATHSPILVDLANPERTIVVYRGGDGSTKLEYFENPEELKSKLSELGVAFSDYIFYEKTRG
jgi:AAA15 family ATPase/GTPase